MHLKFDHRLFGTVFVSGLILSFLVGGALLALFLSFNGDPREYALAHAVPYEGHEAAEEHAAEVVTPGTSAETTVASGPVEIAVGAVGETLTFDTASITAKSGSEVTITFENPSANNQHNLVIVQDGTKDAVAADGTAAGPTNDWVAPGDARVIASTPLLASGASGEVIFTAPAPCT